MESPTSPYEVRCASCDVSFPLGTRQCMHCGGATGSSLGQGVVAESMESSGFVLVDSFPDPVAAMPDSAERELETSDEPRSMVRTLVRSMGGFVWIIVLIGFTLARNCGGE